MFSLKLFGKECKTHSCRDNSQPKNVSVRTTKKRRIHSNPSSSLPFAQRLRGGLGPARGLASAACGGGREFSLQQQQQQRQLPCASSKESPLGVAGREGSCRVLPRQLPRTPRSPERCCFTIKSQHKTNGPTGLPHLVLPLLPRPGRRSPGCQLDWVGLLSQLELSLSASFSQFLHYRTLKLML